MGRLKGRGLPSRVGPAKKRIPDRLAGNGEVAARRAKAWYNTARWRKLRLRIFARDGYVCQGSGVLCIEGHAELAPHCDHIRPHRGDPALFWDEDNLQTLSATYHARVKQSEEKRERLALTAPSPGGGGGSNP